MPVGESKRRRAADPSYGKPKYGLIVSCPLTLDGKTGLSIKSTDLDAQDLRSSLLFWDRLAWPDNNLIAVGAGPDATYLEQTKVLTRPRYRFHSGGVDVFLRAQEACFTELDASEPGLWAIGQGENSILLEQGSLQSGPGAVVELLNAIPVPDKDVPLNEILEFKLKRYDELSALREEINKLAAQVAESDDPAFELVQRLAEVDEKSTAAMRVTSEWQFPVRLSDMKVSVEIKPGEVARDSLLAAAAGQTLAGTTAAVAAALGQGILSSLKIVAGPRWNGLKKRITPYRYVTQVHEQLF